MEEWVEVRAETVDEAVAEGLKALGLESREVAEISRSCVSPNAAFWGLGANPPWCA